MHLSTADTDVWDSALVPSVLVQAGETGLALGDRRHSLLCSLPYSLTLLLLAILSIYRSFPTSVTEELWWWSSPLFALSLSYYHFCFISALLMRMTCTLLDGAFGAA